MIHSAQRACEPRLRRKRRRSRSQSVEHQVALSFRRHSATGSPSAHKGVWVGRVLPGVVCGGQRADCPDRPAQSARQPLHRASIHAAERGDPTVAATAARDRGPTQRAQTGRTGVTGSGEGRRQENQLRACALRPLQIRNRMGGTGDRAGRAKWSRPTPAAQVNAGLQRCRQPAIPRDDQRQPPRSADPCQIPAEHRPCRIVVVPQHHAGPPARQAGDGGTRIGQAPIVGEQPEAGQGTRLPSQPPGEKLQVQIRAEVQHFTTSA